MAPRSHVKWRCLLLCFMCLRLSVSAFVSLSVSFKCLCVCVCHCPCICLNFCLSIYFDLNLYVHLLLSPFMPLHLSLSPSVFPSLSLSVPLSLLLLCVCLSVCLFLWLLVCVPIDAQHLDIWTEAIMRRWLEVVVASVDGVLPQRLSSLHLRPSSVCHDFILDTTTELDQGSMHAHGRYLRRRRRSNGGGCGHADGSSGGSLRWYRRLQGLSRSNRQTVSHSHSQTDRQIGAGKPEQQMLQIIKVWSLRYTADMNQSQRKQLR